MSEMAQLKAVGDDQASEPLPHNIEAEQQLLGAILTNNDIYDRVAGVINESHFYDPVHARIYEVAASRIAKNALASPVTLKAFLEDDPGLTELGGPAYLVRLAGAAISSFAARDYAQMIYDLAVRRKLIDLGRDIVSRAAKVEVVFASVPGGAEVLVDGASIGNTPTKTELTVGRHSVQIRGDGLSGSREIEVGTGKPTRWTWTASGDDWSSAL